MKPINSHGFSRRWLGVGMFLIATLATQAQTLVTFQVDMTPYGSTPGTVTINGSFNGWSGPALINTSGNIWSNTISISDPPGTVEQCKFVADGNYEPLAANRQFLLGPASPPTQVEPLETWGINDWPAPTNTYNVTFQVDMTPLVIFNTFTNGSSTITVSGDFEGWDDGLPLTNNPAAPDVTSNIYSGTFTMALVGFPPDTINYKFRANGGWESPASTGGNNRQATITSASQVLPLVYYNDSDVSQLVQSSTLVNFALYLPNGAVDNTGIPYQKGTDTVWINGDWLGWWGWNTGIGGSAPASAQLFESSTPDVYTNSFVIPAGNSLTINYKYSVDQFDDENGFGTNHVRWIRSYPPSYNMPQDTWSWLYTPGANTTTNIVEINFGKLQNGSLTGGNLPITWYGHPGIMLQGSDKVSGGVWTDLIDVTGNNGNESTNVPATGTSQFFRLRQK